MNAPKAALFTATSRLAPLSMMRGDLPPSSRIQGVRFLAAAAATNLPFSVEPVKMILSTLMLVERIATLT
jgi:hypothetical protein